MSNFKNRIVGSGTESPKDILNNPRNWRVHNDYQRASLKGTLSEIGWIQQVIINKTTGHLIDGHLRVETALKNKEAIIPVVYVELNENEERIALATIDPLSALATTDTDALTSLIADIEARNDCLNDFLSSMMKDNEESENEELNSAEIRSKLSDQFLVPPFSVLDGRQGYWLDRKRAWLSLGIQSEKGRGSDGDNSKNGLTFSVSAQPGGVYDKKAEFEKKDGKEYTWKEFAEKYPDEMKASGDSIFDPVLVEIANRWFCPPEGEVLDPFAGGSVRGVVTVMTGREYTGIDLRKEQVSANIKNWEEVRGELINNPKWIASDSRKMNEVLPQGKLYDMIFSCPPYADLEVYSDDEDDISNKAYPEFLELYRDIIKKSVDRLKDNRFAVWVVGDVRDKKGRYHNFVSDTINAFIDAGMNLYNEAIYIQPIGSLPMRAGKVFRASRKMGKAHQNFLVFSKGSDVEKNGIDGIVEALAEHFEEHRELIECYQKVLVFSKGNEKDTTEMLGTVQIDDDEEIFL